eukprot:GHVU01231183.1.p1 GENE.GHVU01231183.1~~GHVU01231183.1.p1  ORF type:complete len:196 (+),score=18.76 GHVU01231183.1:74-589(+)
MVKQKKKERKWNKRVDSADIVEALAIQKSKDAIAAKKGDSLFVIDTVGKESRRIKKLIKKDYNATKAGVNHKLSKHHISKLKALEPKVGNAGGAKVRFQEWPRQGGAPLRMRSSKLHIFAVTIHFLVSNWGWPRPSNCTIDGYRRVRPRRSLPASSRSYRFEWPAGWSKLL